MSFVAFRAVNACFFVFFPPQNVCVQIASRLQHVQPVKKSSLFLFCFVLNICLYKRQGYTSCLRIICFVSCMSVDPPAAVVRLI